MNGVREQVVHQKDLKINDSHEEEHGLHWLTWTCNQYNNDKLIINK